MDSLTPEKRSWNMSRIRSKDTSIEKTVRSELFKHGFRFRKNVTALPGKPDVVLPKYKTVIFINGCFWHRHSGCKFATTPQSNYTFWQKKFQRNIDNDIKHQEELKSLGWNVVVLWECKLQKKEFEHTMSELFLNLRQQNRNKGVTKAERSPQ